MKNKTIKSTKTEFYLYIKFTIFIVLPVCCFFFIFHTFLKNSGEFASIQTIVQKQKEDPNIFFSSLDPAKVNKYRIEVIKQSKPDWLFVGTSRARSFLSYLMTDEYSSYTMSSSIGSIFHISPLFQEIFSVHKPKGIFLVLSDPMFMKEWFQQNMPYHSSTNYDDGILKQLKQTLYQWRQTTFNEYSSFNFFKKTLLNSNQNRNFGFFSNVTSFTGFNYNGTEKNRTKYLTNIFSPNKNENLEKKYSVVMTLMAESSSHFLLPESGVYKKSIDELEKILTDLKEKNIKSVIHLSLPAPYVLKKAKESPLRKKFYNELDKNLKVLSKKFPHVTFDLNSYEKLLDEHYDDDARHMNLLGSIEVTSHILKNRPELSEYLRTPESPKFMVKK